MQRYTSLQIFAFALVLAACGDKQQAADTAAAAAPVADTAAPAAPKSLYDRLGGKDAITVVIDDFVTNVAADKRINARFAKTNIPHLKQMLVEQVCQATGGPCTYTGKSMKLMHDGLNITNAQFNALAEDLQVAMDKNNVSFATQNRFLARLAPMQHDIVTK